MTNKNKVDRLIDIFEETLKSFEEEKDSNVSSMLLGKCLAYADSIYIVSDDFYLCSIIYQKIDKIRSEQ